MRWFEDEACYVYHLVGAWEEGDEVVLLGCRIADPIPAVDDGNSSFPRLDTIRLEPYLHRWRFNLVTGAVKSERLDDVATDAGSISYEILTSLGDRFQRRYLGATA